MNHTALLILIFFGFKISIQDLRTFRIKNRDVSVLFFLLSIISLLQANIASQMAAGVLYLCIFLFLYVIGILLPIQSGIGFGDVKLVSVLAFGYLHIGVRSLSIYFLSLCCACSMQICLQYLQQRRFPNRIAMAPSIFLAVGLYLYAPMGLLLPQ